MASYFPHALATTRSTERTERNTRRQSRFPQQAPNSKYNSHTEALLANLYDQVNSIPSATAVPIILFHAKTECVFQTMFQKPSVHGSKQAFLTPRNLKHYREPTQSLRGIQE
jgi:hypothetical protein